jgi:hypothetical protein
VLSVLLLLAVSVGTSKSSGLSVFNCQTRPLFSYILSLSYSTKPILALSIRKNT